MSHPWHPNWRGRKQYWDDVRWTRTPEHDAAVGLFRKQNPHGWHNYWYLLFRRIGEDQVHYLPVLTQSFLTTPTGSNQTTTGGVDVTWNNSSNKIEVVGAGGSGGASNIATGSAAGGGGGEYGVTTNFNIANPGTTTFVWQIGTGGTSISIAAGVSAQTAGNPGGDSWWNGTTQAGATIGAIHGNGGGASATPANGGTGGTGGVGTTHNPGGRGGNITANGSASGGGGAAGPNGAGVAGVDTAGSGSVTAGGNADASASGAGTGTAGSTTNGSNTNGGAGTELGDGIHGCGGGAGGLRLAANAAMTGSRDGGLYGGGGGGAKNAGAGGQTSTTSVSGAGAQGIIVLTWAPGVGWGFDNDQQTRMALRKPRKQTADRTLSGEQGTNDRYQQWRNSGWEVQPPQPRLAINKRAPGLKGKSEFAYNNIWPNAGWEPTRSQEPRRKWERAGGVMPIESGIELPFILTVATWGFDIQQQPTYPQWKRTGAIVPEWYNIPSPFQQWFNRGFEEVSSQEPRQRWERRGAYLHGDDGTEFPFSQWFNWGWDQTASQPLHRFWKSPDVGDVGIEFPFIVAFVAWPFDPTFSQEPRRRWQRTAAIMRGDDGTENPFQQWFNDGWEQTYSQPPHRIWKSPTIGDVGTEAAFINWINFGWEQATSQPLHRIFRSPDIGDIGIEFPFVPAIVLWPFDLTFSQEPRRRWQRAAGVMRGPDGTDARLNPWLNWGWEQSRSQEPRRRWERLAALLRGPDGTDNFFTQWSNWGWEPTISQPPHRIWKSPTIGDTGTEAAFILWRNHGWEVQPPQPPRWPQVRRGGILKGDDGTELPFIFSVPTWGFDIQQQPPAFLRPRRGALLRGDDGTYRTLINWFNAGWEVQPWQPPRRPWERRGAILRGDEGIYRQLIRWFNAGWEIQPPQPPRWPRTRRGAVMPIEQGIELPYLYIQFVNQLGEVNLPMLRRWPKTGRGAILRGDEGFYRPFIPSVIPTPGVRPRRLTGKVFIIDAVPSMIDRPLYLFGPLPKVNESCTLVFYVGGGLPSIPAPVLFTFTRPDGVIQRGDVPFAFIGTPTVTQIMIPNFPSRQYLVYQFGIGELSMAGTWKVSAITTDFFSLTYSFNVLPY